jgi:ribosomal biogenesis protein LAS1
VMAYWQRVVWCHYPRSAYFPSGEYPFITDNYNRKRQFPTDSFSPPKFTIAVWTPLLEHLRSHHPDLAYALTNRILFYLLTDPEEVATEIGATSLDTSSSDLSYNICIARWAVWIIDSWGEDCLESGFDIRKETIINLITALGPGAEKTTKDTQLCALQVFFSAQPLNCF